MNYDEIQKRKWEARERKKEIRRKTIKAFRYELQKWDIPAFKRIRKETISLVLDGQPPKGFWWIKPEQQAEHNKQWMNTKANQILNKLYYMDRLYLHKMLSNYFKRTLR